MDDDTPDTVALCLSINDTRRLVSGIKEAFGRGNPSRSVEYWIALGRTADQACQGIERAEERLEASRDED